MQLIKDRHEGNNGNVDLILAAMKGDTFLCTHLLEQGAKVDAIDGASLKEAIKGNHVTCVRLLHSKMTNIHRPLSFRYPNFYDLLKDHACAGNSEMIELLVEYGLDVNYRRSWRGKTLLHFAAEHGHENTMKLLIKLCADENLRDYMGKTAGDLFKEFCLPKFEIKPAKR